MEETDMDVPKTNPEGCATCPAMERVRQRHGANDVASAQEIVGNVASAAVVERCIRTEKFNPENS